MEIGPGRIYACFQPQRRVKRGADLSQPTIRRAEAHDPKREHRTKGYRSRGLLGAEDGCPRIDIQRRGSHHRSRDSLDPHQQRWIDSRHGGLQRDRRLSGSVLRHFPRLETPG